MAITVKKIEDKKELRQFVEFPRRLYKGNPYYVPTMFGDEMDTFDHRKNPSYELGEAELFLAYRDDEVVGRVAAVINYKANERWNKKEVRFGWFDVVDDQDVTEALLNKVIEFGKARGMEKIIGPQGFYDFDPEGMLVEGFDQIGTMVCQYNYDYYMKHVEALGFSKEVDWLEYKVHIPKEIPERIVNLDAVVREKYGYRVKQWTKKDAIKRGLGKEIFHLVNATYHNLYNYVDMTDAMIDRFVNFYLSVMDLRYSCIVEDKEGNIVGFGFSMPSIVKALQKSNGKFFPFGWFHLLKSLYFKHEKSLEMLLVGITPGYENKGVLAVIFSYLIPQYIKGGFEYAESNAELEDNVKVRAPWTRFNSEQNKRRRIYGKKI